MALAFGISGYFLFGPWPGGIRACWLATGLITATLRAAFTPPAGGQNA